MTKFLARLGDQAPQSQSPVSSVRGAIDSLVLGSLVELFAAYDVAVGPLPRRAQQPEPQPSDISASLTFTRNPGPTGRVTLSVPSALLELMRGGAGSAQQRDWARELTNQLAGRIKNRLLQFSVRIQVGALALVDSKVLAHQLGASSSTRRYAGRTLRGEVVVTIQGMPEESELTFVGVSASAAVEGDLIVF
jgi:hypothetical protein